MMRYTRTPEATSADIANARMRVAREWDPLEDFLEDLDMMFFLSFN